jgi:DNA-binding CsgD family transcriptional regulator
LPDYEKIIGAIYDSAANPELWPDTLSLIRDSVKGAYALVGFIDTSALETDNLVVIRRNSTWDEKWLKKLDSLISQMPENGGMASDLDQGWSQLSTLDEAEFQKTEFYQHWVKPQGLRDTINTPYLKRNTVVGMLSIPCLATRGPYEQEEIDFITRIAPHVRRAMMINDVADKGKLAQQLYRSVLDQLSSAVFVVGPSGRLALTNAAGDELLSRGELLQLRSGILCASQLGPTALSLGDAIGRAVRGDVAIGISGIGIPLTGKDGARAAAYVLPIAGKDIRGALGPGHCMVFVAARSEQQPIVMEVLRTLFDLTAMEARVAMMIAAGDGPAAISENLGSSISTVRTHLKSCYAKTRAGDQTALGSLVNGLAPPIIVK